LDFGHEKAKHGLEKRSQILDKKKKTAGSAPTKTTLVF
jgi:hypothetical protein